MWILQKKETRQPISGKWKNLNPCNKNCNSSCTDTSSFSHQQRTHAVRYIKYIIFSSHSNHSPCISKWDPGHLVSTGVRSGPQGGDIDQTDLSRSFSVDQCHSTGNRFRLIRFRSIVVATVFLKLVVSRSLLRRYQNKEGKAEPSLFQLCFY